jgi:hypothetical protein
MRKIPEPNAKVHHLIPQAYMLRFSPDQKHVHVFDRLTGKSRFSGTRQVAAESEFNTVINNQGKKERWVEGRLSEPRFRRLALRQA